MVRKIAEESKHQDVPFTAAMVVDFWRKESNKFSSYPEHSYDILTFYIEVGLLCHKAFYKDKVLLPPEYDPHVPYSVCTDRVKSAVYSTLSVAESWLKCTSSFKEIKDGINSLLAKLEWGLPSANAEMVVHRWQDIVKMTVVERNTLSRLIASAFISHALKSQREEDIKSNLEFDRKNICFKLEITEKPKTEINELESNWNFEFETG